MSLTWTLFDGLARENHVARAKAEQKLVAAEVDEVRDQVENEVWAGYSTARTALREQKAAAALLAAANESYNAALKSHTYGVRSQIDVVSAQRTLATARTDGARPDIQESAVRFTEEIRRYYQDHGLPISIQLSDMFRLADSLASLLAPLYADIHNTFASINANTDKTANAQSVPSQLHGLT